MQNQTAQPRPGDPSTLPNGSTATRAAHIPIDRKRVYQYDRNLRQDRNQTLRLLALGLGMAAAATGLIWLLTWWGITLGVLVGAAAVAILWYQVAYLHYLYGGGRVGMYSRSLLIGAVVVREEPLTVLALSDIDSSDQEYYRYFDGEREISAEEYGAAWDRADQEWEEKWEDVFLKLGEDSPEAEEPWKSPEAEELWESFWGPVRERYRKVKDPMAGEWACMLQVVGSGDWSYRKGDRIPCSSGYGDIDDRREIWTTMEVLPLVWGTRNREDLERCIEAVPAYMWRLLELVAPEAEGLETGQLYRIHPQPEGAEARFRFEPITPEDTVEVEDNTPAANTDEREPEEEEWEDSAEERETEESDEWKERTEVEIKEQER